MRNLIPIFLMLFSLSLFAQQNAYKNNHVGKAPTTVPNDVLKAKTLGPVNHYLSNSPEIGHTTRQGQSVETLIGKSANVFGGIEVAGPRSVMNYDPDINTMTFLYRQDPAEYGNVGNSGWMRYSVSQDGGATWTENNGILWDNIGSTASNARYPQGFIYNPPGNTIADSASQVFFGATLNATNGASWGGIGYGSLKIGGGDTLSSDQVELASANGQFLYIPNGGTVANGKVWALDRVFDWTSGTAQIGDTLAIFEGTVQNGAINFTRTTLPIELQCDDAIGDPFALQSPQIAFSPDGQTGYIALLGRLDSITYPKRAVNIIYFKSTDAGATWSPPSEVYFADDSLIVNSIGDSAAADNIASAAFEMDLVVDTFGNPHTLLNIEWRPDNDYGFTFIATPSTIWHVHSPDGGANWDFNRVGTVDLRYGMYGVSGSNIVTQNSPQISRDANGRYITMAWFNTDTALAINPVECTGFTDGYCGNADRFINTSAYNVVKDFYAPTVAWDFFLQGSYASNFENIAEISPFDGSNITIPYHYLKMDDKTLQLSPGDHFYEGGVSYTKEELGDSTTVGLKDRSINIENVKLFPNPSNNELNVLFTNGAWTSDVKIYNNIGQLVLNSNDSQSVVEGKIIRFDVSSLHEGIYFVRIGETGSQSMRFVKY